MVGVTLSPEQIRNAPPEVRRWLEQELLASFGLQQPATEAGVPQLASCDVEEAAAILSLIQGMLPVVNVFFELGREGISVAGEGLTAFRVTDILRHTRLQGPDQVIACLDAISAAARRIRGDAHAAFYGLDSRGYCFIATQTRRSILHVWQQIIAARDLDVASVEAPKVETSGISPSEPQMTPAVPFSITSGPSIPIWSAPAQMPDGNGAERSPLGIAPGDISPHA
jgi:hypothetical protein